ncbi:MAG TPA: hypothetical protein VGE74_25320, partial [Gemmata sp.]
MSFRSTSKSKLKSRPVAGLRLESLETRAVPDATYYDLSSGNFSQNWTGTDTALSTADNWSGIPSIVGYLGDGITPTGTSTDPQTVTNDSTSVDLVPNSSATATAGGVHEIANDVVALHGSSAAIGPYLQFHMNATGRQDLTISYLLRELNSTTTSQLFALQYR